MSESSSYPSTPGTEFSEDEDIDPFTTSFAQMTNLIDMLCATYFQTFMKEVPKIWPPLSGPEFARFQSITRVIGRYDRSAAFDERAEWPFRLVAGPQEAWIVELLLGISMGKRINCGYEHISRDVADHLNFLLRLQERIGAAASCLDEPERAQSPHIG